MAVVCSFLISGYPDILLRYCLSDFIIIIIIIITMIKSRRISCEGHVERIGRNAHRVLAGKPESKRPLEKPMRRRTNLAQDRYYRIFGLL